MPILDEDLKKYEVGHIARDTFVKMRKIYDRMNAMRELYPEEIYLLECIENTAGKPLSEEDRNNVLKGFQKHSPRVKLEEDIRVLHNEQHKFVNALQRLAGQCDIEWLLTSEDHCVRAAGEQWIKTKEALLRADPTLNSFTGTNLELLKEFNKRHLRGPK